MNATHQSVWSSSRGLSYSAIALLVGLALLATFIVILNVNTGYATTRAVTTMVIAKTQGAAPSRRSGSPYFILAVRHPDGTLQDVPTSFAEYSQAEVGSKWQVSVSDASLRRPMPLKTKVWLAAALLSAVGAILAFVFALFLME